MQRFLTSITLILALGLSAGRATALGFGKVTAAPMLGQPLSFAIALRLDANENIESSCVRADVSFGDRLLPASMVRARVETSSSTGERQIRVSTTIPVDEPILNIELHAGCTSSLSRSFLVFADPPGQGAVASGSGQTQETWVPDRAGSPVESVLSAVPPASAPAERQAVRPRKSRAAPAVADMPSRSSVAASAKATVPNAPVAARSRKPAAAPKPPPRGPVLRLDPVEVDALISPSLQMATSLSPTSQTPASAASGVAPRFMDPEQEQRLRDQERLKAMEATLLKLRSDSEATVKVLNDMQARVRAAEADRYANPLVYLLVALCAVLAAGLGAMWWLRRRDRRAAAWWKPPVEAVSPPPAEAAEASDPASAPMPQVEITEAPATPRPEPKPAPMPMFMPPPLAAPSRAAEFDSGSGVIEAEPRRPMSAEELIDLEQQAEFFVVLGQDDAAIDLLMGHVRSTGGVSPLPYLKLLEIYRRRGEREPYDRIRERFNRRFNAYAPEWDVDPELGLSLEGYPEVMGRLQKAWASPSQAMDLLDVALFRRDAGPTFDVPAYRELLFLYSLSRDLAERDTPEDGVDLLLPLGDDEVITATFTNVPATPVEAATAPVQDALTLDLDVSTDQPPLSLDFVEGPDFKRNVR
jgi:pilus assembly protein FimV